MSCTLAAIAHAIAFHSHGQGVVRLGRPLVDVGATELLVDLDVVEVDRLRLELGFPEQPEASPLANLKDTLNWWLHLLQFWPSTLSKQVKPLSLNARLFPSPLSPASAARTISPIICAIWRIPCCNC